MFHLDTEIQLEILNLSYPGYLCFMMDQAPLRLTEILEIAIHVAVIQHPTIIDDGYHVFAQYIRFWYGISREDWSAYLKPNHSFRSTPNNVVEREYLTYKLWSLSRKMCEEKQEVSQRIRLER